MAADARTTVTQQASARGETLKALSQMLGRNAAYLQQFVRRGCPRVLDPRDRRLLADHFGIDEGLLGGIAPVRPLRLPVLDIAASAGPGTLVDSEVIVGAGTVDRDLAQQLGLRAGRASILGVRGDSMAPGLLAGDQIVVDEADRTPRADGGIYVIRIDDAVLVKRVARHGGRLVVTSDNPATPPVGEGEVIVLGRVVWQMRRPR
ncbi:S24 family peptidase [Sphingomonas bacterium]|uniref:S24 family peptidase n=1 Tax=Sphingomonas bacterium TaxID=1895847 RepID=UPI0015759C4E|nr:S24 family peptidase [Sphingomonas bacterium]